MKEVNATSSKDRAAGPAMLLVAPHLVHPARNGSDISLERMARYLSQHAEHTDLIGCDSLRRYERGKLVADTPFANRLRSKPVAGIRTLLFQSHYFREKFNTPAFTAVVHRQLAVENYGTVLASYLTTVPLLPPLRACQRLLVWTHNDEFKWFQDLAAKTPSRLGRAVACQSLGWLKRELPGLARRATLVHVTEDDRAGFERVLPGHASMVVAVGTDLDTSPHWPDRKPDDPVVLSFVSSLAVQMAGDALRHFRDRLEPVLRERFGPQLQVRVVGSGPSSTIRKLCAEASWALHADVSDEELARLLAESTFTMLPFPYTNGIKLKLVRSLGSGVPFLSTRVCQPPGFAVPTGCCFDDDPRGWGAAIDAWLARPDRRTAQEELLRLAQAYSWPAVVARMAEAIGRLSLAGTEPS